MICRSQCNKGHTHLYIQFFCYSLNIFLFTIFIDPLKQFESIKLLNMNRPPDEKQLNKKLKLILLKSIRKEIIHY